MHGRSYVRCHLEVVNGKIPMLHYMYDLCIPDLTSPCVSLVVTHTSYDMSDVINVLRWYTHTYTCTCNTLVGKFDQNCSKILRSDT